MISKKQIELLQFDRIIELIRQKCFSSRAKALCDHISPATSLEKVRHELYRTRELKTIISEKDYFPSLEHDDVWDELNYLKLEGSLLQEGQLLVLLRTSRIANALARFIKGKKQAIPALYAHAMGVNSVDEVEKKIEAIIDEEGSVKDSASTELQRIRQSIILKRKESDQRFYGFIHQIRKEGFLRENEESFFNGRRTLAVLVEHRSEIPGFVHSKSESGKTIFVEPAATMGINNDIAELEIDERREVNRILRELCASIRPFTKDLLRLIEFLIYVDFLSAKARFAWELNACLPNIQEGMALNVKEAVHPLLYLQNKRAQKLTIPLSVELNSLNRILVISGPNAGGKTVALKTIGLLQIMLQSGLLIPVLESSQYCFFENVLVDIGDEQSIENELSTYSSKLRSMTRILEEINENTLVLMDEFGSGTDPELGCAIAEAVLESLVSSRTKGIITSHFGNVKLLADKLPGAINGSMLFDLETLDPKYILSIGEPGSSYTFEVADRIGFPKHLIARAMEKVDKNKLKLNRLLAEVQQQKTKLAEQMQRLEQEEVLTKLAKEKYRTLFKNWEEKTERDREKRVEQSRLADYGKKYLSLLEEWSGKKDRKEIVKRFMEGITAETKRQDLLRRQKRTDTHAQKRIDKIKPRLKVGSKVRVLNGKDIGIVEKIKDDKVYVKMGMLKMTVGMESLVLAEE